MRKLLFMAISLLSFNAMASSVDVKMLSNSYSTDDEIYQRRESYGVQLSYTPYETGYVFLSYEQVGVSPKVKAWTYTMTGIGIGNKFKLTKFIKLFTQIGYYKIENDVGDRRREFNEGLYYYLNGRYAHNNTYKFEEYSVHNDDTFAGEIGLEFTYPLGAGFNVISSFSYRMMKITEEVHGYKDSWNFDKTGANWEYNSNRNYTSYNLGLGLNYDF